MDYARLAANWTFVSASYNVGLGKLIEAVGNNWHWGKITADIVVPSSRAMLIVEAKAAERSWLYMTCGGSVYFDLANGVVGTVTNVKGYGIRSLGDGWYECTIAPSVASALPAIGSATGDGAGIYIGDGASGVLLRKFRCVEFREGKIEDHTRAATAAAFQASVNYKYRGGVALGDSMTFDQTYTKRVNNTSLHMFLTASGVGGNTLAQILARYDADVRPYNASFIYLMAGINDIINAVADPNAAMQQTVKDIIGKATGSIPVLTTLPPFKNYASWSAARQGWADTYNAWVPVYAAENDYKYIDLKTLLADVDGQTLKAAWDSGDGLHPNTAGYNAAGDLLVTDLDTKIDAAAGGGSNGMNGGFNG